MAFDLDNGVLGTAPFTQSNIHTAFPSPSFSISSNGTQNGIAWAVRSDQFNTHGAFVLYAWDANDLTKTIYESDTNATRDAGGAANRYSIPMVANGKVYVVANGQVDVYGLLNGEPTAAAPTISPNGGTFSAGQSVTLTSATASADIYYTLDGSTPTPASILYTDPMTISVDTTLKALSSASGFIQSGVTFTFIAGAAIGCGGGGGNGSTTPANSGTTSGSYTVTVTGTSGSINATTAITVTVQ